MPIRTTRKHRQPLNVLRDNHISILESRFFDASYIAANSYQEKWVYAGVVVAEDTDSGKFVPYSVGASYGTGSDTPVGVLHETWDMTYDEYMVAPVWHGVFVESHCYIYGGALGTISAAVKTALTNIKWV